MPMFLSARPAVDAVEEAQILDADKLVKGSEQALAETVAAVADDNPRHR